MLESIIILIALGTIWTAWGLKAFLGALVITTGVVFALKSRYFAPNLSDYNRGEQIVSLVVITGHIAVQAIWHNLLVTAVVLLISGVMLDLLSDLWS